MCEVPNALKMINDAGGVEEGNETIFREQITPICPSCRGAFNRVTKGQKSNNCDVVITLIEVNREVGLVGIGVGVAEVGVGVGEATKFDAKIILSSGFLSAKRNFQQVQFC